MKQNFFFYSNKLKFEVNHSDPLLNTQLTYKKFVKMTLDKIEVDEKTELK
jgi:hypothetical protein